MNKQQLAARIWESANKMRSKIEANEYKDYILGFIFYKFLSEKEEKYLKENDWADEDFPELQEQDTEIVESIQRSLGYFISYNNLFSTWLSKGRDFSVQDVRDALSAFSRLINTTHRKVFDGIFDTLQTGLSKLGDSAASQSKAISDLIYLIKDIPMDGKQDYDVLGFIYEYLIGMFAANAGKKAGEFYTPHEVSLLMSEIIADHLKDRDKIEIYDSTSGSGSLLINIGKSAAKFIDNENNIKYYAQELKQNTYNLTRMNLIMRGILPDNIVTRNGDTLEEDWPDFDENDPIGTYKLSQVDAVVSNPPYSQAWNPKDKETDPRYARFGLAPKGKADYAFLLHDLFHLKSDGIMSIVLPHGVLFRGGEEGEIRKNLVEQNHIDTIIGLPSNIFFGTGIPTIIMVLKQKRANTDILIVDASKGFIKVGKNNKLRACDIKKIVDVVTHRESVEKFSRVISREEIRKNEYNLNIPRYVDSSESAESWDIYASMFGGIPISEIDELKEYWTAFPKLKTALFKNTSSAYCCWKVDNIKKAIKEHCDVISFEEKYQNAFNGFDEYLSDLLIEKVSALNISRAEAILSADLFDRIREIPLVDRYEAYQLLDDCWTNIAVDVEIIQTEGFEATKKVDPNIVSKKKNGKEQEVQEGWVGRILPFDLVQRVYLCDDVKDYKIMEDKISEISIELDKLIDLLSEDEKQKLLNDENTAFAPKEIQTAYGQLLENISTPEIDLLQQYLDLGNRKRDKLAFIEEHSEISWNSMVTNKDGTYGKKEINKFIQTKRMRISFDQGSYEDIVTRASNLLAEEKSLKKEMEDTADRLHLKTKNIIEGLSDDEVLLLLKEKWITPLIQNLMRLLDCIVNELVSKLESLTKKYEITFAEVEAQISETEKALSAMINDLEGNEFDMLGLHEFQRLLGDLQNE